MRPESYSGKGSFRFLNCERDLGWPVEWSGYDASHLWRYNLHYFDYLHQPGINRSAGLELIRSWIHGNSPMQNGVGWEPYPTSLRLVNWIKFCSVLDEVTEEISNSLLVQADNLQNRVEYHLLANHLWSNGKALWFTGVFLGNETIAEAGRKIILQELSEQFVADGGHFELSPMYHSIILEDLLDLTNLCQSSGHPKDNQALPFLRKQAGKSLSWLQSIVDQEGKIPLLNDSAHGAAASYEKLKSYGERLGVDGIPEVIREEKIGAWTGRNLSGYWVLEDDPFRVIFDAAPMGPDYQPGHAHCDMLSILMDFDGRNILTDTGVYEYEEGPRRHASRSTESHNTVMVDCFEQAELWKSFRVGRRGYPQGFDIKGASLKCGQTGFSKWRRGLTHERRLLLLDNGFEVEDQVRGPERHGFKAFFHFAPGIRIRPLNGSGYCLNERLSLIPWGARGEIKTSEYYPEFGKIEERPCLILSGEFSRSASFGIRCTYSS